MKPTGGAAFPLPDSIRVAPESVADHHHKMAGLTIRDYFAATALQGILSSSQITGNGGLDNWPANAFAEFAYQLADAMLEERQK